MDNHISPQNPSWQNGFESHTSTPTHQKEKSFQETLNEALSDQSLDDSELAKLLSMKDKFKKEQINLLGEEYQGLSQEITRKLEELKRELSQDMKLINLDGVKILIDKGKYNKEYIGFFLENVSINNQNAIQIKDIILKMLSQGFEANTSNKSFLLSIERQLNSVFLSLNTPLNDLNKLNGEVVLNSGKFIEKFPSVSNISTTQENTGNQSSTKQSKTKAKTPDDLPHVGTQLDLAEDEGPITPITTNKYIQKDNVKIENNSSIAGTYTVNIKDGVLNKRDIRGNIVGTTQNGETLKINGYQITLGGKTFYQAEGVNNKLFYVAADYLTRTENKADMKQTQGTGNTVNQASGVPATPETAKKPETDNKDSQATSLEKVEEVVEKTIVTPSISGDDFNKAIQARGKTITLENGIEIRKVTTGFRVTENGSTFTVSEKSVMEKGNRFYKSPTDITEALLSAKNTETAKEELAKIKDEIEKISMTVSEFFVHPIQPHEQAWIDTLSGDKVTLNVKSVIKNAENDTVITFDIDDFGFNDKINSNFQYKILAQGIYSGNDDFKQIVISELQKKVYEEPKMEEIFVSDKKIESAFLEAVKNTNSPQTIGEVYKEKISLIYDGKGFFASIGNGGQIGIPSTSVTEKGNSFTVNYTKGILQTTLQAEIKSFIKEKRKLLN